MVAVCKYRRAAHCPPCQRRGYYFTLVGNIPSSQSGCGRTFHFHQREKQHTRTPSAASGFYLIIQTFEPAECLPARKEEPPWAG